MRIQSFDIFDTLLTRTVAVPRDLFLRWGETLRRSGLEGPDSIRLADLRALAESGARQRASHGEVTLADIYAELARMLRWDAQQIGRAQEMELQLEAEAIRRVPQARQWVQEARGQSDRILFLSDMYLPSEFLKELLQREGLFQTGDLIRVSGESGHNKSSGAMFRELRRELPPIAAWSHMGDNAVADVEAPRREGISPRHFRGTTLNRYEARARGSGPVAPVWRSELAAAMRLGRLAGPSDEDQAGVIWSVAADVVGPLLFGFVRWCLETAATRNVRRLYFVARDGQILSRIAAILQRVWKFEVECRYLYGSRQAWRPAALDRLQSADLTWLTPPDHHLSVRHVLARAGVTTAGFESGLTAAGFPAATWERPLSEAELERVRQWLFTPEVADRIRSRAVDARACLLDYLTQESFFDGTPSALVDIGWFGNLQRSLGRVLELSGRDPRLTGLYFALAGVARTPEQVLLDYWSQLPEVGRDIRSQNLTMFEIFTAADHGSVCGYHKTADRVEPVLASPHNDGPLAWGLESLHEGVLAFASEYAALAADRRPPALEYQAITRRLFEMFYRHPTPAEARVWGAFPLTGQEVENIQLQPVPALTRGEILAALWDYRKRPTGWWMEGTLALHPLRALRWFIRCKRLKALLRR
jgi:predicted HAD superfamily hydrolase